MPTVDEVFGWIVLLFIASAIVLAVYYGINPKNRIAGVSKRFGTHLP